MVVREEHPGRGRRLIQQLKKLKFELRADAGRFGIRSYSSPTRTSPIRDGSEAGWRHLVRESLILPFVVLGLA